MKLSPEAREARNRYQRELYQRRKANGEKMKQHQDVIERYWLKKAKEYAEQDAKKIQENTAEVEKENN